MSIAAEISWGDIKTLVAELVVQSKETDRKFEETDRKFQETRELFEVHAAALGKERRVVRFALTEFAHRAGS